MRRKVVESSLIQPDGTRIVVRVLDGLLPEDILIQGMKVEGFRMISGSDTWTPPTKQMKDYLIRLDRSEAI